MSDAHDDDDDNTRLMTHSDRGIVVIVGVSETLSVGRSVVRSSRHTATTRCSDVQGVPKSFTPFRKNHFYRNIRVIIRVTWQFKRQVEHLVYNIFYSWFIHRDDQTGQVHKLGVTRREKIRTT